MFCSLVIPNFELGIHSNVLLPATSNAWHELSEVTLGYEFDKRPVKTLNFQIVTWIRGYEPPTYLTG